MVFEQQPDEHFEISRDPIIRAVRPGFCIAGFFAVKRRVWRHDAYPQHVWAKVADSIFAQHPIRVGRVDDIQTGKDRIHIVCSEMCSDSFQRQWASKIIILVKHANVIASRQGDAFVHRIIDAIIRL